LYIADAENRAAQRVEIHLATGSDDAKLIPADARIPARIHRGMDAARVLNKNGRRVLYADLMNSVTEKAGGAQGFAEKEIHSVDAMAGNVVKRTAS
jgi:hypothetical protein